MATVLFCCDASPEIGFGHLMRCLALADACRRHGDAVRVVIREDAGAARVLRQALVEATWLPAGCSADEAARRLHDEAHRAGDHKPTWAVVDTYERPELVVRAAQRAGASVLMIDDEGQANLSAQMVVNWNLDADASWYPSTSAHLLLGGSYACLRREFADATTRNPGTVSREPVGSPITGHGSPRDVRRLLVTLGGSDAGNCTELVLRGLAQLGAAQRRGLTIDVALGPGYAHRQALERLLPSLGLRCAFHHNVSNMAELMRQTDVGVIAAGGTLYEAACVGLPSLVIVVADNQVPNAQAFSRRGIAVLLGRADSLTACDVAAAAGRLMDDREARARMGAQGRAGIDGRGAERIRQAMAHIRESWAVSREPAGSRITDHGSRDPRP